MDTKVGRTSEEETELLVLEQEFMPKSGDTYAEDQHSEAHQLWKQSMNDEFARLTATYTATLSKVLYLDGEASHTTTTLRRVLGPESRYLVVANHCTETATRIVGANEVVVGEVGHLLVSRWADTEFSAVYLDVCHASADLLIHLLRTLLDRRQCLPPVIVGFTLTPRDPAGEHQQVRLDRIEAVLLPRGWKRVMTDSLVWLHEGVSTRFYRR